MALRYGQGTRAYLATVAPGPRKAIRAALRLLEEDARHPKLDFKLLRGRTEVRFFRARVGDYRIVYTPRSIATYVWRIQHRRDGYDWLDQFDPWN